MYRYIGIDVLICIYFDVNSLLINYCTFYNIKHNQMNPLRTKYDPKRSYPQILLILMMMPFFSFTLSQKRSAKRKFIYLYDLHHV